MKHHVQIWFVSFDVESSHTQNVRFLTYAGDLEIIVSVITLSAVDFVAYDGEEALTFV